MAGVNGRLLPVDPFRGVQFTMALRSRFMALAAVSLLVVACLPGRGPTRPSGPPVDATVPGNQWTRMTRPEDADWFSVRLREARALSDTLGSAAVVIVHRGVVVESWGSTARKYSVGEVGRSIVSVLHGCRVGSEEIPAADARKAMEEARLNELIRKYVGAGAPSPGQVLGEGFATNVARPIDMEHFAPADFEFGTDGEPRFMMTASDLARLGLLHLNRGKWGARQLIPWNWIDATTLPPTRRQDAGNGVDAGWTPLNDAQLTTAMVGANSYAARSAEGVVVAVLPTHDLVVVHMVDAEGGKAVSSEDFGRMLAIILRAKP
jgi:CubicO group peptidase (beta-lactamase class C family)